jgi:hypothetical protein
VTVSIDVVFLLVGGVAGQRNRENETRQVQLGRGNWQEPQGIANYAGTVSGAVIFTRASKAVRHHPDVILWRAQESDQKRRCHIEIGTQAC